MTKTNLSIASFILAVAVFSGCSSTSSSSKAGTSSRASSPETASGSTQKKNDGRPELPPDGKPMQRPDGAAGGNGGPGMPPGGGMSKKPSSYDASVTYSASKNVSDKTISSTGKDENAVLVNNGAAVRLDNVKLSRKSSSSTGGDASSFYGVGAAALVTDGKLYINDSTVATNSRGGAGVFAYGDGTAYVANTTINTEKDTSGGIHVAGAGSLYAWNVYAETKGESSAAIRSDRGGGKMVIDGGSYVSGGTGSPAIYSTADIAVKDADLTAKASEAICIEGLNSIHLFDCSLSGNMADLSQNDCTWNVILYQSMSGDSQIGNSTFEMQGGKLVANNGGMFYSTNTESTFILKDVDITYSPGSEFFLKVTGNSNKRGWGKKGANGADTKFTAISQNMEGDVLYDRISNLDFYMTDGSTLRGSITDDESSGGDGNGEANLYIDSTSKWIVTGYSFLTNLSCSGKIVDVYGKTVSVVNKKGNAIIKGDSKYTVSVKNFDDRGDVSAASKPSSWSDYKVENTF